MHKMKKSHKLLKTQKKGIAILSGLVYILRDAEKIA